MIFPCFEPLERGGHPRLNCQWEPVAQAARSGQTLCVALTGDAALCVHSLCTFPLPYCLLYQLSPDLSLPRDFTFASLPSRLLRKYSSFKCLFILTSEV